MDILLHFIGNNLTTDNCYLFRLGFQSINIVIYLVVGWLRSAGDCTLIYDQLGLFNFWEIF